MSSMRKAEDVEAASSRSRSQTPDEGSGSIGLPIATRLLVPPSR